MLGQGQSTDQGGSTGQDGYMRLRPSSEFTSYYKGNASFLLQMYDKAYAAYLTEQANVKKAKSDYYLANSRVSELAAEKQTLISQRAQFMHAANKWQALYTGLDMEHKSLIKERNEISSRLSRASGLLLTAEQNLLATSRELAKVQAKNAELEGEVQRLKSGTPELIKAAFREKKQPTVYDRVRSVPGRIVNLGSPATQAASGAAWLLAALFVIGRIE